MTNSAEFAAFRPTLAHKLGFHRGYAPWLDGEDGSEFLVIETTVTLSRMDRLRALLSGTIHVETRIYTEEPVNVKGTTSGAGVIVKSWAAYQGGGQPGA